MSRAATKSDTRTITVRCEKCPECRRVTLQPGESAADVLAAMDEHIRREHGAGFGGGEQ